MPSPFLAAVGNAGQGFQQGASSAADMRTKMMQLQQLQMALDQAQKILTAQGDYYKTMSAPASPGGAPSGVPAGPGSPPPAGPGPFAPAGPGTPTSSPFSMGGQPPSPPMQPGGMAPPRPPMAPQGGVPPQGGLPTPRPNPMRGPAPPMQPQGGQPQGQGGPPPQQGGGQGSTVLQQYAQALNSGQMDSQTMIQDMARKIAQTNPGIDPEIGFKILQQGIDMMHSIGLSPEAKLNSALTLAMLKGAQGQDLENLRQGGRIQLADENGKNHEMWVDDQGKFHMAGIEAQQEGANARQGERDATQVQTTGMRDSTSLQNTQARIQDADKRLTITQEAISKRAAAGLDNKIKTQAMTQRLHALTGELSAAKAKLNVAANASPPDQKGMDAAQKSIDQIDGKLKILEGATTGPAATAGAKQGGTPPPRDKWPSASGKPDGTALTWGGKTIANVVQGQWVPMTGGQ